MMKKVIVAGCVLLAAVVCSMAFFLPGRGLPDGEQEAQHVLRVVLWDYDTVSYDRRIIQAFEAQNPDITVEVTSYSPTYYDFSLEALLASDEQIDVIYANQLPQFAWLCQEEYLLPLDDFITQDGLDLSCYSDTEVLREPDSGAVMGLPYRQDKFLLYYNKDLFDQAGLPYPSSSPSWEEVCDLAQQLSDRLEGKYGIYFSALPEHLIPQSLDQPFDYMKGDFSALEEGLAQYQTLEETGAAPPFSDLDRMDPAQRLFETGAFGMFLNGSWYLNFLAEDTEAGVCDFRWGVTARPGSTAGAAENPMMLTPICIHSETTEPEAAWRFLRFVCGMEGAEILADEMVLPAYHSGETDAQLAARARNFGIDETLVLDDFDPPETPPTAQEREIREAVYARYKRILLGLDGIDTFCTDADQARKQAIGA